MTIREHELNANRLKVDETRRKLEDLAELQRHIRESLNRLESGPVAGPGSSGGDTQQRMETLQRSLDEIASQVKEAESELEVNQQELSDQEHVRDGFDRVPVAVGSRRGRGQVEHVRIVRTHQRG